MLLSRSLDLRISRYRAVGPFAVLVEVWGEAESLTWRASSGGSSFEGELRGSVREAEAAALDVVRENLGILAKATWGRIYTAYDRISGKGRALVLAGGKRFVDLGLEFASKAEVDAFAEAA